MKALHIAAAAALAVSGVVGQAERARAADYPPFSVFGEEDDEDLVTCGVSHASAIARVEQALRRNGVSVQPYTDESTSSDVIFAYVMVGAVQIKQGEKSLGSCAISVNLTFESFGSFTNPQTGEAHFGQLDYCHRSALLIYGKDSAQRVVNDDLANFVPQCLDEYEKTKDS